MYAVNRRKNENIALSLLYNGDSSAKSTDPVFGVATRTAASDGYWSIDAPEVGDSANSVLYTVSGSRLTTISFANDLEPSGKQGNSNNEQWDAACSSDDGSASPDQSPTLLG